VAPLVAALLGLACGALAVLIWQRFTRRTGTAEPRPATVPRSRIPEAVIAELSVGALALDESDGVLLVNRPAYALGVIRSNSTLAPELRRLVRQVRRDGVRRELQLALPGNDLAQRPVPLLVHAFSLGGSDVAVLAEDITEVERVESVRRDFVANVGHEIKTPVGAIALLAEAALDAEDDREAVQRFLVRVQHEAGRLSRLVQELVELSRLQGGEPLPELTSISVNMAVEEAVDRVRAAADARGITIVHGGDLDVTAVGNHNQLVTAVRNLLENAIAYSEPHTSVAVGVHDRMESIDIAVKDEGIGIDQADLGRIFERFYRADPARSRETGGTGLGLAIVKHIVGNHGGEVTVSSRPDAGSTFTIRLPAPVAEPTELARPTQEVTT
jgi:two-component system sensor histidine kinase SenX3